MEITLTECSHIRTVTERLLFAYIQKRVKKFHKIKSKLENKFQTKCRKHKATDTNPLKEPLKNWDSLTVQEQHELTSAMIDVIYVNHENKDVEIVFGI